MSNSLVIARESKVDEPPMRKPLGTVAFKIIWQTPVADRRLVAHLSSRRIHPRGISRIGSPVAITESIASATRTGDGYVLSGTQQLISSGAITDLALVFAVTDSASGKHGISAFIVEDSRLHRLSH